MAAPAPSPPGRRTRLLTALRLLLAAAALGFVGLVLAGRWSEVREQLGLVSPATMLLAFLFALAGLGCSMLGWRALLADLGSPLPVPAATRVLFLGQLAKYLPGSSVWAVLAQTELATDHGVPRKRAAVAALALNLLTLGVGLLVALLALPSLLRSDEPAWLRWSPVLLPVGLACLTPPVLTRLCNLLLRVLRRQPLEQRFSWRGLALASAALLGTWVCYGLQVTALGWDLGGSAAGLLLPATGAFAAAWCAGFLVVLVPTGAGTRELVLTLALGPQLVGGQAAAITVAVLSRLLMTVADVVAAGIGAVLGSGAAGRRRPGQETADEAAASQIA